MTRKLLIVVVFAGCLWLGIRVLERAGRAGWAGGVVRQNLESGIDATPLFYTELDRDLTGEGER